MWDCVTFAAKGLVQLERPVAEIRDAGVLAGGWRITSQCLAHSISALPLWCLREACAEMERLEPVGEAGCWSVEAGGSEVLFRFRNADGIVRRTRCALDVHRLWEGGRWERAACGHPLYTLGVAWCRMAADGGVPEPLTPVTVEPGVAPALLPSWIRHCVWVLRVSAQWDGRGVLFGTRAEFAAWDERRTGLDCGSSNERQRLPAMVAPWRSGYRDWMVPGRRRPGVLSPPEGSGRGCRGLTGRDRVMSLACKVLASVPLPARNQASSIVDVPVRELVCFLWVSGWRPLRDRRQLWKAIRELDDFVVQVGERRWQPVQAQFVRERELQLDGRIRFSVVWPPGSTGGARIAWDWLRRASALGRRARWIGVSLAFEFDRQRYDCSLRVKAAGGDPRGSRVYGTVPGVRRTEEGLLADSGGKPVMERGAPVRDWNHKRVARTGKRVRNPELDHVPPIQHHELAELVGESASSNTKQRAKAATLARRTMAQMQDAELVDIERVGRGGLRVAERYSSPA